MKKTIASFFTATRATVIRFALMVLVMQSIVCWDATAQGGSSSSQSRLENFLNQRAIKNINNWAHPLNTYQSSSYYIDNNKIWIRINYNESYMLLSMEKNGNVFERMKIIRDTDPIPAFSLLWLLKVAILEEVRSQGSNSKEDRLLLEALDDMTGPELQCLLLTILWNT